jgi:hypothetical protein
MSPSCITDTTRLPSRRRSTRGQAAGPKLDGDLVVEEPVVGPNGR